MFRRKATRRHHVNVNRNCSYRAKCYGQHCRMAVSCSHFAGPSVLGASLATAAVISATPWQTLSGAVQRGRGGSTRAYGEISRLATAIDAARVRCDDVVVPFRPNDGFVEARLVIGWPLRIGFESDDHAALVLAAAVYLSSLRTQATIVLPRPSGLPGARCPDLVVEHLPTRFRTHLEAGATDADAIYEYLDSGMASHVLVLPYAGIPRRPADGSALRGLCFRQALRRRLADRSHEQLAQQWRRMSQAARVWTGGAI